MQAEIQSRCTTAEPSEVAVFGTSLDHILAELQRMDVAVRARVQRVRAHSPENGEFPGLCITDQEVDAALGQSCGLPEWAMDEPAPGGTELRCRMAEQRAALDARRKISQARGVRLRLDDLARWFQLSSLDLDIVLLCLAAEMDLRYEKLYAYLQDDVTKKRPSVDLILNLLCSSLAEKIAARNRLSAHSPLIDSEILSLFVDPSQPEPTFLRRYCKLDDRIVAFLLEHDEIDERLRATTTLRRPETGLDAVSLPESIKQRLQALVQEAHLGDSRSVLYFQGSEGVDKPSVAEALCHELGLALLVVEGKQLLESTSPGFALGVRLIAREARLQRAAIHWRGFTHFLHEDKAYELGCLWRCLTRGSPVGFLDCDTVWEPSEKQLGEARFIRVELPRLDDAERLRSWNGALPEEFRGDDVDLSLLSSRFRLNAGSIGAAAATAVNLARWRDPQAVRVTMADLYQACRLHSNRKLALLARKVEPRYRIADIVVPPDQLSQLREMCDQARFRHIVYGAWGFDRKLSIGKGLNALFSGPPGTGKTMAAEVVASELHLELYKIDLSQVVSKYIGETEKNLDLIFREAHGSNAILFFDEADALFGKRSEVKDAHDRYANIEVGYLLQKMEEYEGIAVLATNLRQNLDEAFVRRLHVIIEFPFPDEEHRRQIWQAAVPREAPVGDDVDFGMLAREIRLAGGNIKNILLTAAFFAASDGKVIRMPHLVQAARREYEKLGKTWIETGDTPLSRPVR
ncbi:MAG: AAA family ATPase [Verrucomicrobiales bacterium]|nr:AAA family ATPase [Verrucomicrobiales bacterium]